MLLSIDCRYIRERPSGIGAYLRALLTRLPQLAPDLRLRLWTDPRAARPLTTSPRAQECVVAAPANGLRTLTCPTLLAPLRDVDVFHAPFNLLGRGIPCPTVVTVHDVMWLQHPTWAEGLSLATPFKAAFYRDGILRALRRATRIVAISHATAAAIRCVEPSAAAKVRVVHHGVDARFRPSTDVDGLRRRLSERFGLRRPYVLVVGQNTPSKNHAAILRAFALADAAGVELVLLQRLYAGRRGGLVRLAGELGVRERVRFLQRASSADVVSLLQGAELLLQFSLYEGFGMPALEAMACATPVIVSDTPALREVVADAGVVVPLSTRLLASSLRRVLAQPAWRQELAARGLERCRSFSWRRSAALHLEVYREAAGRLSGSAGGGAPLSVPCARANALSSSSGLNGLSSTSPASSLPSGE